MFLSSGKCSWLRANVSLDPSHHLYPGQAYRVTLDLSVPPSDNVGMFMTCVSLRDKQGKVQRAVPGREPERCRSALAPRRGAARKVVEAVVMTPMYLMGMARSVEQALQSSRDVRTQRNF